MPFLAKEVQDCIAADLKSAAFVSITTDGWSTPSAEAVMAVTTHFVDNQFKLQSRTVAIDCFEDLSAKGLFICAVFMLSFNYAY